MIQVMPILKYDASKKIIGSSNSQDMHAFRIHQALWDFSKETKWSNHLTKETEPAICFQFPLNL